MTNDTRMFDEANILSQVVLDVEYAITDMLLKSLFSECAAYYEKLRGNKSSHRQLITSGQVIGISSLPNDIITDGMYRCIGQLTLSCFLFSSLII